MSSHFNMPEFDHKAFAKYLAENKLTPSSKLHSLNEGIEEAVPFEKDALDEENLEEMANFFTITQDQKDKLDPEKYTGAKKLVAQALKDKIEPGEKFKKSDIKDIIGKDPFENFKAVVDDIGAEDLGKTADVNPKEPKTPGIRGRKKGTTTTDKKEPSMSMSKDKVVGVRDIDGPRAADVTAAEKELGGAKGIDRTIAIDKAGKAIIAKLKDSKEQLKDPKFKEAKRLAFIAYLTRSKNDFSISQEKKNQIDPQKYTGYQKLVAQALKDGNAIKVGEIFNKDTINKITGKNIPTEDFKAVLDAENISGGKIGLRKGGETYTNLLQVWDNTVEDLIS